MAGRGGVACLRKWPARHPDAACDQELDGMRKATPPPRLRGPAREWPRLWTWLLATACCGGVGP
eukprot:7925844-Alexandrium_andersonii.AAC.1